MPPIYEYECYKGHRFEVVESLAATGSRSCDICEERGDGFAFAHRVISASGVHIPGRSVARKFGDDTIKFAETQTRIAEAKARKVQPLR